MSEENNNLDADAELDAAFDEFAGESTQDELPAEEFEAAEEEATQEVTEETEEPEEEQASDEEVEQAPDELTQLKSEVQQWQHRYNSNAGRMSAYQRKIQEQEEQIRALQKPSDSAPAPMDNKQWDSLKQDYPDIADAIEGQMNALKSQYESQIEAVTQQIQPLNERQQEQYVEVQMNALNTAHPDWKEVVQTQEYGNWLQSQPLEVQSFMQSTDADKNIYLLDQFKAVTQRNVAASNQLQQKRNKQLQQSRTVPSRSRNNARNINDDDYEAAFDHFADKLG